MNEIAAANVIAEAINKHTTAMLAVAAALRDLAKAVSGKVSA